MTAPRPPRIHHCTSEPYRFFGRDAELALLDEALADGPASLVALVGPGGQGKTAVVQHWLERLTDPARRPDGLFLWSFYRGKDADLCLRELYAYAEGLTVAPDVSAAYCVDHLLPVLRRERWAIVLDGAEVGQYEAGPWAGRFLHPELGRLLEELASEPMLGVVVLTTRFPLPTLSRRRHARLLELGPLDPASARALLESVGVCGEAGALDAAANAAGRHAKAVELLGTYLAHYHNGDPAGRADLGEPLPAAEMSDEERCVARVLAVFQRALPAEAQDVIALATAFRDPPTEARLLEYLASGPAHHLLHDTWARPYPPFAGRPAGWLAGQVEQLVALRLLERVGRGCFSPLSRGGERGERSPLTPNPSPPEGRGGQEAEPVIDAHPLVRRSFEYVLGPAGRRAGARARAGFLRGRPDRRRPATLEEAREEVELFHAYCDAGLWEEADATYLAFDNPKHRFPAPALERDLLVRFFPEGDWRRPPLWPGFGRRRSLAICLELLGQFEDALDAYPERDAALRGDALLALGRLGPLLARPQADPPWQTLWGAYRCHALCLAGRPTEAVALARALVPLDVYEWAHVFECLLRAGRLDALDPASLGGPTGQRWTELARRRMRADHARLTRPTPELGAEYAALTEAYDRAGLPLERALTRLGHSAWLLERGEVGPAEAVAQFALQVARSCRLRVLEADAWALLERVARQRGDADAAEEAGAAGRRVRSDTGYSGPARP